MCPCHAVCLLFCYSCCCWGYCYYTQSRYLLLFCCWHRLLFLLLPLCYFCPCHAVAYLAVPVVAKHAETNVKYPAYTSPPDHTEILQTIQILQIVQTASQLRCTDHSNHTDSTQADHTDPADYTDPGDRWKPQINMCRSCRSYRPYLAKDVQIGRSDRSHPGQTVLIVQLTHILLRYTHLWKL